VCRRAAISENRIRHRLPVRRRINPPCCNCPTTRHWASCNGDAGNFKGVAEIESLRAHTAAEAERYAAWARTHGYGAATFTAIGHDIMGEVMRLAAEAKVRFPKSVFFAGQLAFARETRLTRFLHNSTAFTLQRRFFVANLPFVVLPIRVGNMTV
jgi:hypothetical protein